MIVLKNIIFAWQLFFKSVNHWQDLIPNQIPKISGCGLVYELGNPLNRENEDCAIADMRTVQFTEPHYHPETEIYFVLQGSGILIIGTKKKFYINTDDVIVIPPNKAHFIAQAHDLVIGVINTPPFNPNTYIPLYASDSGVDFCYEQFKQLTQ